MLSTISSSWTIALIVITFVFSAALLILDIWKIKASAESIVTANTLRGFNLVSIPSETFHPRLRNINAGITICTLLGLLGTFIGMSQGLSEINATDDKLIEGAKNLIGNMSFAFSTSLWGISASAALTIIQSLTHAKVKKRFKRLYEQIHSDPAELDRLVTPIELLARIERAQSPEAAREMSKVVHDMSLSVSLLTDAARGFNLDALGGQIAHSLEQSVMNHMKPPLENLAREVRDLRQSHENQREEMLRSVIDELNTRVFTPITGQISELATLLTRSDATTQSLVTAVKLTSDDLTRVSESIHQSLENMRSTQQETYTQLQRFVNFLHETLTNSNKILAKQHLAFQESSKQSAEMLTQVREDTRHMFEVVTQDLARSAASILLQAKTEVEEGLRAVPEMLAAVRVETQQQLTSFRDEYQRRLQTFMDEQRVALEQQRSAFEESSQRSAELLTQVREDSRVMLEEVTQRVVKSAVEILARARVEVEESLHAVPEMLTEVRVETQAQLSSFREAYQARLEEFMRQQNAALEAQRLASEETARGSAELLTQARAEVEQGLRAVPEMLSAIRVETQGHLTTFREEYQRHLTAFMEQQSAILNDVLGEQREALAGIVRDLQVVFEDEYTRRRALGEETSGHIQRVADTERLLSELSQALGAQAAVILPKIAEASQQVAEQMRSAYMQYQQLERVFSSSTAAFSSASVSFGEQVQRIVAGVQERQDQLFETQDRDLAVIFNHLVQVTEVLSLATREIQTAQQVLRYDQQEG